MGYIAVGHMHTPANSSRLSATIVAWWWNIVSFAQPIIVCKWLGNFKLNVNLLGVREWRNVTFEVLSGQEQPGRGNVAFAPASWFHKWSSQVPPPGGR